MSLEIGYLHENEEVATRSLSRSLYFPRMVFVCGLFFPSSRWFTSFHHVPTDCCERWSYYEQCKYNCIDDCINDSISNCECQSNCECDC